MRTPKKLTAALAALTATGLLLSGCGQSDGTSAAPGAGATAGETSPMATDPSTTANSTEGSEADIAFAQMMIPHHEQAVEMASMALEKASSPQVKELATKILAAQDPEIETMRAWLTAWGAPEDMGHGGGHDMGNMGGMTGMTGDGMMSDQQMSGLDAATGAEFDTMWLTMMIEHHQGAVAMAQQILGQTSNPEVKQLADAIVAAQTQEITTMQGLLKG